jgi:tetratricopeptide (TPR) repeat protein
MYNLLISLGGGVLAFILLKFAANLSLAIAIPLALLVFVGIFYLLSRIIMKKVMDIVEAASKDLQAQRVEKGIRGLQGALKYGKWQVYVTGQINAQIGMIHYMKRDFAAAFPYLEKAFFKNWVAMGMLAVSHMKRSNKGKMVETFEKAVQGSPKEALLWNLYAWCLNDCGDTDKAKEVMERGLKKLPGDERLTANLEALREGKRMKMKNYGEMWLQFHLEKQSVVMKQQAAAMGVRRRVIRK